MVKVTVQPNQDTSESLNDISTVRSISMSRILVLEKVYKLLKICFVKTGQSSRKKGSKIDGTRVAEKRRSGHRHSILVREIDNFDSGWSSVLES